MTIRTSQLPVTFRFPFSLSSIDGVQPAGTYLVETDEEELEMLSQTGFRRISTAIILPLAAGGSSYQRVDLDPAELGSAIQRDLDHTGPPRQS